MSDEEITFDGVVEDISSGADAGLKVTKGFFPKTLGLFDETLYNWLKPKLTPKQSETIEAHLLQASEKEDLVLTVDHTEISSATALVEWVDSVKDLDPVKYPYASERWHDALRNVLKGSREMLLAMQKVKPETIERFAETGTITLDDAIEFEKLGLGALQNPNRQFSHHTSERDGLLFFLWALGILVVAFAIPAFFGSFILRKLGWSEDMSTIGMLLGVPGMIFVWREFRRFFLGGPEPRFGKTIVTKTQRFLQSHLGAYVLTTAFGANPNKTVLWDVDPVEEDRARDFIKKNPGYRRDM